MASPEDKAHILHEALILMVQRHDNNMQRITELQSANDDLVERARKTDETCAELRKLIYAGATKFGVATVTDTLDATLLKAPQDHRLDDPVGAILYATTEFPGKPGVAVEFLRRWRVGDLDGLDEYWPNFKAGYGR